MLALGILGVGFALPLLFAPAIFLAWALTLAALLTLSREPAWRRAASIATAGFLALVVLSALGSGAVVGWRGRTFLSFPGLPGAAGWASVLMLSGIAATGLLLLLAPERRTRRLAQGALASAAALALVAALVAAGEKIAGLLGLFGAIALALVAAALLSAIRAAGTTGGARADA